MKLKQIPLVLFVMCLAGTAKGEGWAISDYPQAVTGASVYVEPNIMMLLDTSGSMGGAKFTNATQAIRDLVNDPVISSQSRLGLARLGSVGGWSPAGGTILVECNDNSGDNIIAGLENLSAGGGTPVAEAYYEITRYFRGAHGRYYRLGKREALDLVANTTLSLADISSTPDDTGIYPRYQSPVDAKYGRCQSNHIIVLTDGAPTSDGFSSEGKYGQIYSASEIKPGAMLSGATDDQLAGIESLPDWNPADTDSSRYYLDDLALWAKSRLDLSAFHPGDQPLITHTIAYQLSGDAATMLKDAAEKVPVSDTDKALAGKYVESTSADITEKFKEIFTGILGKEAGQSNPIGVGAASTTFGALTFKTNYMRGTWTGSLIAEEWDLDQSSENFGIRSERWDSTRVVQAKADSKEMITNLSDGEGKAFRPGLTGVSDATIDFFRGNMAQNSSLRLWDQNSFGSFINSKPIYVDYGSKGSMVFVGGNDGMLHGFNAETGMRTFAYIPGSLLPELESFTEPDRKHSFRVDGSPIVVDLEQGQSKRKLLIGGLNGGGRSIYVLDISDPDQLTEANASDVFLGEFTPESLAKKKNYLGSTFSQPQVVYRNDGEPYLIFGGGFNRESRSKNSSQRVAIFIVPFEDMEPAFDEVTIVLTPRDKFDQGHNKPNGMATLTAYDADSDAGADYIYGGDLFGNIWRFDIRKLNKVKTRKIFRACSEYDLVDNQCLAGTAQPITSKLTVAKVNNRVMVLFGTGKDFEAGDNNSKALNSLYGVYDSGTLTHKGQLLAQTIISENITATEGFRYLSKHTAQASGLGWYIDLQLNGVKQGEKVLYPPYVGSRGDFALFSSRIYEQSEHADACDAGNYKTSGWYYFIDPATGGQVSWNIVVGKDQEVGGMITDGGEFTGLSTGCAEQGDECDPTKVHDANMDKSIIAARPVPPGRQSWRQLFRQ